MMATVDGMETLGQAVSNGQEMVNNTSDELLTSHLDSSSLPDVKDENDFDDFCNYAFPEDASFADCATISEPFYFESDHVALKGNEDYRRLLRAFALLQSQRMVAVRDLDHLLELQRQALDNPLHFVQELRKGKAMERCPGRRHVAELPSIGWERYTDDVEAILCSLGGGHHSTRQKQKRELLSGIRDSGANSTLLSSLPGSMRTSPALSMSDLKKDLTNCDNPRPITFNQSWSSDEQRHLERLLQKYPPERFESRRFAKIAKELPGRTTQQVASRVQKYFIKLAKAGLPVPGRMPNLSAYGGRGFGGGYHRHQRYNRFYFPSSTFLTSYEPPVYMSDDENDDTESNNFSSIQLGESSNTSVPDSMSSDDDDDDVVNVPSYLRNTSEFQELEILTMLRKERLKKLSVGEIYKNSDGSGGMQCGSSTVNSRVTSCQLTYNIETGVNEVLVNQSHNRSHIDTDYTSETTGISSYLDPNYMPAV